MCVVFFVLLVLTDTKSLFFFANTCVLLFSYETQIGVGTPVQHVSVAIDTGMPNRFLFFLFVLCLLCSFAVLCPFLIFLLTPS